MKKFLIEQIKPSVDLSDLRYIKQAIKNNSVTEGKFTKIWDYNFPTNNFGLVQSNNIYDFHELIEDFSDTAVLISEMDIVISVDTSVAHLAGALNKPLWVLLPYVADYRWMIDRIDSPWYPSATLFRQKETI